MKHVSQKVVPRGPIDWMWKILKEQNEHKIKAMNILQLKTSAVLGLLRMFKIEI